MPFHQTVNASLETVIRSGVSDRSHLHAFGRRLVALYKKAAILVLNALVCFVCFDLAATGLTSLRAAVAERNAEDADPRSKSSYFASQGWAQQYWREFKASRRQTYRAFVIWRRHAFAGDTINIDDAGVRLTPGARCTPESLKVFVFGGSTVWGTGSPDWGTLPAYLQKELTQDTDRPLCVVNYGESAFVSTQSVVQLILELQKGNVPDIVVSYEGPNDTYGAYQSGRAGLHQNMDDTIARFDRRSTIEESPITRFLKSTNLFAATARLLPRVAHAVAQLPTLETYETRSVDKNKLSADVAKAYLANYDIVDGLAREYGFDFWFFWPPYIGMGRKALVAEEAALASQVDSSLDALYRAVYGAVAPAVGTHPHLFDMTDVFDDYSGLVWLDDIHVIPEGNGVLAAKIARTLRAAGTMSLRRKGGHSQSTTAVGN